ncbi:transcriptional regulator, LysR family [Dietzia kunjamensis subsp. schimae]|uniref:Transcriptional regulator, LysR family n=1 Tax=Dietzia kunjamensis subsp. schimae TaxID=498198 RepID=A0ABY1MYU7_9ACTN|nr:LysR family transcriptional regulator [Dietzia kunjamensis]MBB1015889.1 LysR family transcriptional regulator [Dietzia kunjamensis subsp. schimae]SMO52837.1 transcriptional regulator, LysR family [Dietzia kunjamensis subsp. schimae]
MEPSLHRLRLLAELERRSTVTAVAAALGYTVSAVSQQLSLLEREAGTPLFEKRGRGLALTEAGLILAGHARTILSAVEDAGHAMESARAGVGTNLTAGVWASVAVTLLPAGMRILARDHPGIVVRTRELAPEDTTGAVRDGSLDLSFVLDYSSYVMADVTDLVRVPIARESLHAVVPRGFVDSTRLSLADLSGAPWVVAHPRSHFGRAVRIACREAGFEPDVRHEAGEQSTALSLVAAGLGVTLASDLGLSTFAADVEVIPLADELTRTVSITYRRRDARRRPLQAFVEAFTDGAREVGLDPA